MRTSSPTGPNHVIKRPVILRGCDNFSRGCTFILVFPMRNYSCVRPWICGFTNHRAMTKLAGEWCTGPLLSLFWFRSFGGCLFYDIFDPFTRLLNCLIILTHFTLCTTFVPISQLFLEAQLVFYPASELATSYAQGALYRTTVPRNRIRYRNISILVSRWAG